MIIDLVEVTWPIIVLAFIAVQGQATAVIMPFQTVVTPCP